MAKRSSGGAQQQRPHVAVARVAALEQRVGVERQVGVVGEDPVPERAEVHAGPAAEAERRRPRLEPRDLHGGRRRVVEEHGVEHVDHRGLVGHGDAEPGLAGAEQAAEVDRPGLRVARGLAGHHDDPPLAARPGRLDRGAGRVGRPLGRGEVAVVAPGGDDEAGVRGPLHRAEVDHHAAQLVLAHRQRHAVGLADRGQHVAAAVVDGRPRRPRVAHREEPARGLALELRGEGPLGVHVVAGCDVDHEQRELVDERRLLDHLAEPHAVPVVARLEAVERVDVRAVEGGAERRHVRGQHRAREVGGVAPGLAVGQVDVGAAPASATLGQRSVGLGTPSPSRSGSQGSLVPSPSASACCGS